MRKSKYHRYVFIFVLLSVGLNSLGFCGLNSGADFLKIPVGARAASLGQAFTAMAEDVEALNWNPAGIVKAPLNNPGPFGLSLSHQSLFEENSLDHLGITMPLGRMSAGLNVVRLSYANQEGREADRSQSGSFSNNDMSVGGALAYNFGYFQMGSKVNWIRQQLASNETQGVSMDLGVLSRTPLAQLSMGAAVRNLGPSMKFINESFRLPLTVSLGGAYRVKGPLALSLDIQSRPYEHQMILAFGTEIQTSQSVSLRAGYLSKLVSAVTNNQKSETSRGNPVGVDGLTGGLGLHFNQFTLDYAMVPFGELGINHSFTISTRFGGEEKSSEKGTADFDRSAVIFGTEENAAPLPAIQNQPK